MPYRSCVSTINVSTCSCCSACSTVLLLHSSHLLVEQISKYSCVCVVFLCTASLQISTEKCFDRFGEATINGVPLPFESQSTISLEGINKTNNQPKGNQSRNK